jgi:hypothetical protein
MIALKLEVERHPLQSRYFKLKLSRHQALNSVPVSPGRLMDDGAHHVRQHGLHRSLDSWPGARPFSAGRAPCRPSVTQPACRRSMRTCASARRWPAWFAGRRSGGQLVLESAQVDQQALGVDAQPAQVSAGASASWS